MSSTYYQSPLTFIVQYFTNVGVIASGATVTTYLAGSVSTLQTTYTDSTGLVQNSNPLTLNSSGRAAGQSGALTAFWQPAGVAIDAYFTDTVGETWSIKNISGINDPSGTNSLQTLLASASSSNSSGVGPVAGADLVANAIKSYDVIADVRSANEPSLVSGQTLSIQVQGGTSINDGLGGDFYWNATSTSTDNGTTVIKPSSITGAGRWIRLGTPPFGGKSTLASASTTDLGQAASNVVSITGTTAITNFGSTANLGSPLYFLTFVSSGIVLTYQANTMILPGGANITTQAQDSAIAYYLGSGSWQVLAYFRYATQPPVYEDYFVKAADQSITSSTTLTADTTLQTVIAAGTYLIQLRLQLLGSTSTTQGYKVQLNFGGSITGNTCGSGVCTENGVATAIYPLINNVIAASAISDTASAGDCFNADYMVVVSASGTLAVEFAQNSSSANATTMKAGSSMIVKRLL